MIILFWCTLQFFMETIVENPKIGDETYLTEEGLTTIQDPEKRQLLSFALKVVGIRGDIVGVARRDNTLGIWIHKRFLM